MNLRTLFTDAVKDKPTSDVLTQLTKRINLIWMRQHDQEGAHTNITAISAVIGTLTVTVSAAIAALAVTTLAVVNVVVSGLLNLTGGQIQFPATQNPSANANTLDDYEEGAWTPTDGSGAGLAFAAANGSYVKIGRSVTVRALVQYPATGSAAAAILSGLPFTVANVQGQGMAVTFTTRATPFTAYGRENTGNVELLNYGGAAVTNANMSGAFVGFCGAYISTQ